MFHLGTDTARQLLLEGHLPSRRTPGGQFRVRAGDLAAWLRRTGRSLPPELSKVRYREPAADTTAVGAEQLAQPLAALSEHFELATAEWAYLGLVQVGAFEPDAVLLSVDLVELLTLAHLRRLTVRGADSVI